jgi:hypothetical protein
VVYKLRNLLVIEDRIRQDHTFFWFCFSHFTLKIVFLFGAASASSTSPPRHLLNLYSFQQTKNEFLINYFLPFPLAGAACPGFGRLAPYLERL